MSGANPRGVFQQPVRLPGENKKYLHDYYPKYGSRWKALSKKMTRKTEDCYDVLSSIAHGSALGSHGDATIPKEIVSSMESISAAGDIYLDVGEYISDAFVSRCESNWHSVPDEIRGSLGIRFGGEGPAKKMFEK